MPQREESELQRNLHPARRFVSRSSHGSQKNPRGCHAASLARNGSLAFLGRTSGLLRSRFLCRLLRSGFLLGWRRFLPSCSQRPFPFPLDILAPTAPLDKLIILFSHKLVATS